MNENPPYTQEELDLVTKTLECSDYYEILGVERTASTSEITTAYRQKSKLLHPDKNPAPGASEAFKELTKAHNVLKDPEKRCTYDEEGEAEPEEFPSYDNDDFEEYDRQQRENIRRAREEYAQRNRDRFRQKERNYFYYLILVGIFFLFLGWLKYYGDREEEASKAFLDSTPAKKSRRDDKNTPPYHLHPQDKTGHTYKHVTSLLKGVYYTKHDFDKHYEVGSKKRSWLEKAIEGIYADMLEKRCYKEKQEILDILNGLKGTEHGPGSPRYRKYETKLRGKTKKCLHIVDIKDYLGSPTRKLEDLKRNPDIISFLKSIDELNYTITAS